MKIPSKLLSACSLLLLLLGWQLLAVAMRQPELIPSVPRLLMALVELLGSTEFYQSVGCTLGRGLLGLAGSAVCAALTAWLLARHSLLEQLFRPWLTLLRSVPVISFILLALIFLNPEQLPLLIAFLTCFPLLTENFTNGLKALRPSLSLMAKQFQLSRYNRLTQIYYPQLRPFLFSGLTSAAGFGWRAIIMGEALAQCATGIGSAMKVAQNFLDVPSLLAWTVVAILISHTTDQALRRLAQWQPAIRFAKPGEAHAPSGESADRQRYVRVDQLGYRYAIHGFSHLFEAGRCYGFSAPSGRGKTTLLHLLSGTLRPTEGSITPQPSPVARLFEYPELLPQLSALQNVALPLAACYPLHEAEAIAREALTALRLTDAQQQQHPNTLSYGQQQRVALARALAFPAPYLMLDEPFKGADEALKQQLIRCIQRQKSRRAIIWLVSHDPDELALLADQVITL